MVLSYANVLIEDKELDGGATDGKARFCLWGTRL